MKEMSSQISPDLQIIKSDLIATYSLQRQAVNEGVEIKQLSLDWPFLFHNIGMECHFSELVGKPILQTMSDSYISKVPHMMAFFSECKKPEVISTFCEINAAKSRYSEEFT